MNQEEFELYRELQPVIRKKMGEVEDGDTAYHPELGTSVYFEGYYRFPKGKSLNELSLMGSDLTRIPDVVSRDPERPERGLWGMVDWAWIEIHANTGKGEVVISVHSNDSHEVFSGSLLLVLLNALKWQTEQEAEHEG